MKFSSATPRLTLSILQGSLLLALLMGNATAANQGRGYSQNAQRPGFFERASDNIGGFFHRLFNSDDVPPPPQRHHQRSQQGNTVRPGGTRLNLDEPPSGVSPATPKSRATGTNTHSKSSTGSSKSAPSPTASGEGNDHKIIKSKTEGTNTDKMEVVVKSDSSSKKINQGKKTAPSTSADVTSPRDTKSTGNSDTTTPTKISQEQNVLTGSKTSKAGRVKSPYPPYNELDVSGLTTGSLALDPTTQKVFKVP